MSLATALSAAVDAFAPLPVIAGRRMKPKKTPFSFAIGRGRREERVSEKGKVGGKMDVAGKE